jgi:hypothetical protein
MDRRRFLQSSAAALAVLAGGGIPAAAAARSGVALSSRRAAAYRALVEGLGEAPGTTVIAGDAAGATRAFARWYAGQDAKLRGHADAVLDGVADALGGGGLRGLRRATGEGVRDAAFPTQAEAYRRAAVVAAIGLAGRPDDIDDEEDGRTVLPTLG